MVTILVAAEGAFKLPKITSRAELKSALAKLGALRAQDILAVEVSWLLGHPAPEEAPHKEAPHGSRVCLLHCCARRRGTSLRPAELQPRGANRGGLARR